MEHREKIKAGQILKNLRFKRGLTLRQIRIKTGISHSYLSQIENDKKKPSADVLIKLATIYNEDIITLLRNCGVIEDGNGKFLAREEVNHKIYTQGLKELKEDKALRNSLKITDFEIERLSEIKFRKKKEIPKFDYLDILLTLRKIEKTKI